MGDPYYIVRMRGLRRADKGWLKRKLAWHKERVKEIELVLQEREKEQS